jgi:hypothetical protein
MQTTWILIPPFPGSNPGAQPHCRSQMFAVIRFRSQDTESAKEIISREVAGVQRRPLAAAKFDGIFDGTSGKHRRLFGLEIPSWL